MKINGINTAFYGNFGLLKKSGSKKADTVKNTADAKTKGGIYIKPVSANPAQRDTITQSIKELSKVKFSPNDILYMKNLGINLPFMSGMEAVEYLNRQNISVSYAEFSNPDVHACLDTTQKTPVALINSNYKDLASFSDILAISEALIHEIGHAKDGDSENSIQEELDCLALNVLAHEYHKKTYPDVFEGKNEPLFSEGVSLYPRLFFDFDPNKAKLKNRVAEKYGFLDISSKNHQGGALAGEIKNMAEKQDKVS